MRLSDGSIWKELGTRYLLRSPGCRDAGFVDDSEGRCHCDKPRRCDATRGENVIRGRGGVAAANTDCRRRDARGRGSRWSSSSSCKSPPSVACPRFSRRSKYPTRIASFGQHIDRGARLVASCHGALVFTSLSLLQLNCTPPLCPRRAPRNTHIVLRRRLKPS